MRDYFLRYYAAETETGTGETIDPPVATAPAPVAPDWRAAKIIKQKAEITRLNNELAAKNAKELPKSPAPAAATLTEADVESRAQALVAHNSFTQQCVAAAAAGAAAFGKVEFESRVNGLLSELRSPGEDGQREWNDFLQASLDTGDAGKVLFELGADMEEAERIYQLPPLKRVLALQKLADKADAEGKAISSTPKPLPKVGARSNSSVIITASDARSDGLSSADWHARRSAEVAEQRGQRRR